MKLQFIPVASANRDSILRLSPALGQESFLEPVADCLAEADKDRRWNPVGIYDGAQLVGFAMYGFFLEEYPPYGRLWMDRLLTDAAYQGKGYGKLALAGLLQRLAKEYPPQDIFLSVVPGNTAAASLYAQFGFIKTGEKDVHQEDVYRKRNG